MTNEEKQYWYNLYYEFNTDQGGVQGYLIHLKNSTDPQYDYLAVLRTKDQGEQYNIGVPILEQELQPITIH